MTRRLTILAVIGALLFVPVFTMSQDPIKKPDLSKLRKQSSISGHDYVDLGLSVKWARCNIGAFSPEQYGSYFAWGETSTKSSYTSGNSKTYRKSSYNHDKESIFNCCAMRHRHCGYGVVLLRKGGVVGMKYGCDR